MGVLEAMPPPSRPHSWYQEAENFLSMWPQACFRCLSSLGLSWGWALPQMGTFIGLSVGQERAGQGGIIWMECSATHVHTQPHMGLTDLGPWCKRGLSVTRDGPGTPLPVLLHCNTALRVSFESGPPGCYEGMFFSVGKVKFDWFSSFSVWFKVSNTLWYECLYLYTFHGPYKT